MNRASFDEESWIGVRWAEGCMNRPSAVHRCGSGRSPWMFLLCQEIDFISQCYFIPLSPRFLRNGRQGCILHKTVSCVNYLFGLLFGLPCWRGLRWRLGSVSCTSFLVLGLQTCAASWWLPLMCYLGGSHFHSAVGCHIFLPCQQPFASSLLRNDYCMHCLQLFPGQMLGLQKKKKKLERSRFHHLGQSNQLRKTSLNQLQMEDNASWLHWHSSCALRRKCWSGQKACSDFSVTPYGMDFWGQPSISWSELST